MLPGPPVMSSTARWASEHPGFAADKHVNGLPCNAPPSICPPLAFGNYEALPCATPLPPPPMIFLLLPPSGTGLHHGAPRGA